MQTKITIGFISKSNEDIKYTVTANVKKDLLNDYITFNEQPIANKIRAIGYCELLKNHPENLYQSLIRHIYMI